jgi:hypothetical protein
MSSVAAYIEHPAMRRTGLRVRGMAAAGAASMQPMAADRRAQGAAASPNVDRWARTRRRQSANHHG